MHRYFPFVLPVPTMCHLGHPPQSKLPTTSDCRWFLIPFMWPLLLFFHPYITRAGQKVTGQMESRAVRTSPGRCSPCATEA